MSKPRIAFDINNTLDNYIEVLLNHYNEKYEDNIKFLDIVDYKINKFLKPECENLFFEFTNERLMTQLRLKDNAKEVLGWCNENFEIRFETAIYPHQFGLFYDFLKDNFNWIKDEQMTRIVDKQYYDVDTLVDDYQNNLIGGKYHKILIDAPWNKNFRSVGVKRCHNLLEVKEELIREYLIN